MTFVFKIIYTLMLKTYIAASFLKSFPGKDFVKPVENGYNNILRLSCERP